MERSPSRCAKAVPRGSQDRKGRASAQVRPLPSYTRSVAHDTDTPDIVTNPYSDAPTSSAVESGKTKPKMTRSTLLLKPSSKGKQVERSKRRSKIPLFLHRRVRVRRKAARVASAGQSLFVDALVRADDGRRRRDVGQLSKGAIRAQRAQQRAKQMRQNLLGSNLLSMSMYNAAQHNQQAAHHAHHAHQTTRSSISSHPGMQ